MLRAGVCCARGYVARGGMFAWVYVRAREHLGILVGASVELPTDHARLTLQIQDRSLAPPTTLDALHVLGQIHLAHPVKG